MNSVKYVTHITSYRNSSNIAIFNESWKDMRTEVNHSRGHMKNKPQSSHMC